jgi:hypothetical protein
MRKAKEMVEFSKQHNNFQLQGRITFQEFIFIKNEIKRMSEQIIDVLYCKEYWDHVVIIESLRRDRPSVYTRFLNRLNTDESYKRITITSKN